MPLGPWDIRTLEPDQAIRLLGSIHGLFLLSLMSHDDCEPNFYKIIKHEQPGTGFWPTIPSAIWRQTVMGEITSWTHKGLIFSMTGKLSQFPDPLDMILISVSKEDAIPELYSFDVSVHIVPLSLISKAFWQSLVPYHRW